MDVADVLIRLVDKSLVVVETAGVSDARYRLLEVVREYAARLLAASGEAEAFRNAHARWYVERAAGLDPEGGGGFVSEPDAWFVSELENLRIALASMLVDDPRRALAAIVAAWRAWLSRGLHAEGLRWLSRALAASPEPSDLRARALFGAAVFEIRLGRSARAGEIGRQIARIGPQLADQPRRLETLHQEALLSWLAGRWAETDRCVAELNGPLADCPGVLVAHEHLRAILALSRGDIRGARSAALASLAALDAVADDNRPFFSVCSLAFSVGHVRGLHFPVFEETMLAGRRVGAAQARPYVHSTLAWAERMAGQWQAAVAALDQAGRGFRAIDDPAGQAHVLVARGHLLREMGELETSRECFRAAIAKRREANDQRGTAIALTGLALCEANTGAVARARDLADEGARLLEGSGDLPGRSGALDNRAALEVVAGNLPGAAASVEEALSLAAVTPSHRSAGWQHTLLAGLRWRLGDPVGAAAEAQAARDVFSQIGEQRGLAAVRRVAFASSLQSHR